MEKDWCVIEKHIEKHDYEILKKMELLESSLLNCWKMISQFSEDDFNFKNEIVHLKTLIDQQNDTIHALQKELEILKQHDARMKEHDTRMKNQMIRTKQPFSFRPETIITDITFK